MDRIRVVNESRNHVLLLWSVLQTEGEAMTVVQAFNVYAKMLWDSGQKEFGPCDECGEMVSNSSFHSYRI